MSSSNGFYRAKFTAHYTCRNVNLNLILLAVTNNGLIFQIIDSLIESMGVRLTWCDCKSFHFSNISYDEYKCGMRHHMFIFFLIK